MENKENTQFMSEAIYTAYIDSKIQITLNKWEKKQQKQEEFIKAFDEFIKNI